MNHLARKKIVLVIVEGASDDTALGVALNQVFDKDSVYIHIMHGDITTRKGVNSQNIISKIGDEVKGYAKSQHYKASDFKQIKFISESSFSVMGDFKESWKFIEKDMNSIERYTNLCICIVEETNCGTIEEK